MPRHARIIIPGLPYHITQRGTNRQRVFFTAADRSLYLRLIRENLDESATRVIAYCLMTNHIHFIVIPERDDSLALLFGRANGRYAQALNIRKGRSGHLWQARFHSCPMSGSYLWIGIRYVEANPCRAGLATTPDQYRWSSAHSHLHGAKDKSRILDHDFYQRAGGQQTWSELHQQQIADAQLRAIRKCTYAGRPFGDQSFTDEIAVRTERHWVPL